MAAGAECIPFGRHTHTFRGYMSSKANNLMRQRQRLQACLSMCLCWDRMTSSKTPSTFTEARLALDLIQCMVVGSLG